MELSPKQQTVELIKKSNRVLVIGHKNPDGDLCGSSLAIEKALISMGKTVELIISDKIPEVFKFLPNINKVKKSLLFTDGKILRIDTRKFPVSSMSVKNADEHIDIILDANRNLKFEFLEIINGMPKPDIVIVLDTPDVETIDKIYDKNTELFFEVPIVNIDHHPGNEYFGTVNLVDLTASSTSEILVSLFEALGVKISDPDAATCLLCGIVSDTQSFRSQSTTPKSLTVAAQLLAAGGRQQEIISNLYKKKPIALMKLWGEMIEGIQIDKEHSFAWTKVAISDISDKSITTADIADAADELLTNTPDADTVLILCETEKGKAFGKLKGRKGAEVATLAKSLGGEGSANNATFSESGKDLAEIELKVIKKIHDFWSKRGETKDKNVFDVIGEDLTPPKSEIEIESTKESFSHPETEEEIQETTEVTKDPIDTALKSIEKVSKIEVPFSSIKDVIAEKKKDFGIDSSQKTQENEIDVFDESDDDGRISNLNI